jgi:hypothetical protein
MARVTRLGLWGSWAAYLGFTAKAATVNAGALLTLADAPLTRLTLADASLTVLALADAPVTRLTIADTLLVTS